jgi:response regulator RpfG family c-di-GMP phosphodiesterase
MPQTPPQSIAAQCLSSGVNFTSSRFDHTTVLYIDDEYVNYLYLSELLIDSGINLYRVYTAEEVAEYLFSSKDIALVILSSTYAGKTAREIYPVIKRIHPQLPIITIIWEEGDLKNEVVCSDADSDLCISGYIDRANLLEALSEFHIYNI